VEEKSQEGLKGEYGMTMKWYEELGITDSYYADDSVCIIHGDCRDVVSQLSEKSIDLVLTDPPYPREFGYTYNYLADYCPRVMTRGASLITIVGHYAIPEVLDKFKGKLKYRWMFCMAQFDGIHARMAMGIEVVWKPCLWFVKEAYPQGRGFIVDGFQVNGKGGQEKKNHKWEQDTSWAKFFVGKLARGDNDIILDPFLGSGTTALVARELGRKCIGIELEEKSCEIATIRYLKAQAEASK